MPSILARLASTQSNNSSSPKWRTASPTRPRRLSLFASSQRQDDLGCQLCGARFREGSIMASASATSSAPPQVLLGHHLRQLKLPTFLREYEKIAAEAAREGLDP